MLIVGERINTSRKRIRRAVEERDASFIQAEAQKQVDAGAALIDVNAGTSVKDEVDDLKWLVETVQGAVDVPLCIDTTNTTALAEALKLHQGQPMINSITGEAERIESFLPLVKEHDALVVALTMTDAGMPTGADERLTMLQSIVEEVKKAEIALGNVYVDPCIRPVSTNQSEGVAVMDAVRRIKADIPELNTICGLSNISFGLPRRNLVNSTFLPLMMMAGLDAAIIDPTESRMVATILTAEAILGRDEFCMEYIMAERAGKLGD